MHLNPLSLADCEQVRLWRNEQLCLLRTAYPLTSEQQEQFYREVVCNRQANARYWGLWDKRLVGMCGIENIQWENRLGEISLLFDPDAKISTGDFREALHLVLRQGFFHLNLENIFSEVYVCNPNSEFWFMLHRELTKRYPVTLPNRKYWEGQYYDSYYFDFTREDICS